jgi:hypothetical protein
LQQREEHHNHQSPTWAITMNRISPQALKQQNNCEDNGDGVTSNNEQWKEHNQIEKLWPLNLSPITPNPKLASKSKKNSKNCSGSNFLNKFKIGVGFVVGCCQSSKFFFCGCVLLFVHYYLLHHQHCLCDSPVIYVFMVVFVYCCSPCWWLVIVVYFLLLQLAIA